MWGDLILIIIAVFALLCLFSNSMNENFDLPTKLPEGIYEGVKCISGQKLYTDNSCKNVTKNFCVNPNTCGVIMHTKPCADVSAFIIDNCENGYTLTENYTKCTCNN